MTTAVKREKAIMQSKTNYMEVVGNNRVIYRVTTGYVMKNGRKHITYGVEAEKKIGPVSIRETIDNFSDRLAEAVGFAEMLLKFNIKPTLIYNAALCFLRENI